MVVSCKLLVGLVGTLARQSKRAADPVNDGLLSRFAHASSALLTIEPGTDRITLFLENNPPYDDK
jgi:hypothetical protein